jgi:hypothetical protein
MKAIISAVAVAGLFSFAACNNSANNEKQTALQVQHAIDSMNTELAKRKVIDSMNEVTKVQYVFPQNAAAAPAVASPAPQTTRVVYVRQAPKKRAYSSHAVRRQEASTDNSEVVATSSNVPSTAPVATAPVYQPAPVQTPTQTETKRSGWSAKAKGAVIGAGTGAAAGAILNGRNRAAGAVIGGILGAGVGTGIGAVLDHKNGR